MPTPQHNAYANRTAVFFSPNKSCCLKVNYEKYGTAKKAKSWNNMAHKRTDTRAGKLSKKETVNFTLEQATKAQRGSRGITLLFL